MTVRNGVVLALACIALAGCGGGGLGLGQMFSGGGGQSQPTVAQTGTLKTADDVDLYTTAPTTAFVTIQDIEVKISKLAVADDPSPLEVQAGLQARGAELGADAVINVKISNVTIGPLGNKILIGTGTAVRF